MSEKESYISNSVSSQDDMQDMTILNPFVFYDTQIFSECGIFLTK